MTIIDVAMEMNTFEAAERLATPARPTEGSPTLGSGSNGGGPAPADLGHFHPTAAERTLALSLAIRLMLGKRWPTFDELSDLRALDDAEWGHFIAALLAKAKARSPGSRGNR